MKKIIALILVLMMVLSLAACGGDNGDNKDTGDNKEPAGDTGSGNTTPADPGPEESTPAAPAARLTDDELVDKLAAICEGKTGEMPVETTSFKRLTDMEYETAGLWANWFSNMAVPEGADIAVNQPMMGQAHVVLLIQPAEGTSAEDLKAQLDSNANPGWMICMTADSVASAVKDGLVLFVMTSKELGLEAQTFIDAFNA